VNISEKYSNPPPSSILLGARLSMQSDFHPISPPALERTTPMQKLLFLFLKQ